MASKKRVVINPQSLPDVINVIGSLKRNTARFAEIEKYQNHAEGSKEALAEKYFPSPSFDSTEEWLANKASLKYVNLTQILIRTWQSILCGDNVVRQVTSAPGNAKSIVEASIKSYHYQDVQAAWVEQAMVSGTQVIVPLYDEETTEFTYWLPNPASTEIITDPANVSRTLAVIEYNEGFIQFVSLWGQGSIYSDGSYEIVERNYSFLPVSIGYGHPKLHAGQKSPYGRSMISEAVDFSILVTNSAYNLSLLNRQQTRDILLISGPLEKIAMYADDPDTQVGLNSDGTMIMPEDFKASFMGPNPKIAEAVSVLNTHASLFAKVTGLPIDLISPELVQSASAEAARIRALPLMHRAKQIVPRWLDAESRLVLAMIYLVEYHSSGEAFISLHNIKTRSQIHLENSYNVLPSSPNERTQNNIALEAAGMKSLEDCIREEKPNISDDELRAMLDAHEDKLRKGNPKAIEQEALKESRLALTGEQKAAHENAA